MKAGDGSSRAGVYVARSPIHGEGVFAARQFAAGDVILAIDDSRVVDVKHPLQPERGELAHHCDYLAGGKVVLMASPERYINSSCDPKTFVQTSGGARYVVARRPIRPGEEITYDYIINCHGGAVWDCACGSERCRGTVPPSFFDLPIEWQMEYLPLLDRWFVDEHLAAVQRLRAMAAAVE